MQLPFCLVVQLNAVMLSSHIKYPSLLFPEPAPARSTCCCQKDLFSYAHPVLPMLGWFWSLPSECTLPATLSHLTQLSAPRSSLVSRLNVASPARCSQKITQKMEHADKCRETQTLGLNGLSRRVRRSQFHHGVHDSLGGGRWLGKDGQRAIPALHDHHVASLIRRKPS